MFTNATVKLTLMYMGILTVISFLFSYNWYTIATDELNRGLEKQLTTLNTRPIFRGEDRRQAVEEITQEAIDRYEDGRQAVLNRIIATNIIVITSGTLGSYFLAKRTLRPIEKAHAEQVRFTADASHELRTPIAAMRTEIEVALRDPKLSKQEAIALLGSSIDELSKLTELSEGLLRLARQDESIGLEIEPHALDAIISKAVSRVEKTAKQKKITLLTETTDAIVLSDFESITEMVVILLDNAIKYSPQETSVRVVAKLSKSFAQIHIIDNGIGVRSHDRERIFERFYRADISRSSQNVTGHGLGLSIAKNISDIHDAGLRVESSDADAGTTFTFRLRRTN